MAKLLHLQWMWQMRCQLGTIRWACFAGRCRLASMPKCLVQWIPWTIWSAVSKWERKLFDAESISLRIFSAAPFGADLFLSIVYSTSIFGWRVWVSAAGHRGGSDESARNHAVSASLTRYSHRRWTATTIPCYVAIWRRSLSCGGVNESQICFSSRWVCSGVWPER